LILGGAAPFDFAQGRLFSAVIRRQNKHSVIPTGAGAPATAEWRDLLLLAPIGGAEQS
jgi:hypothetical protein